MGTKQPGKQKQYPTGVKPHGPGIQIYFKLKGEKNYTYETLPWQPSPANLSKAGRLRADIVAAIKHNTFRYAEYFPDSPNAQGKGDNTFFTLAQSWLNDPGHNWSDNTRYKYKQILNTVWVPHLYEKAVHTLTYSDLNSALITATAEFKDKNEKEVSQSAYNNWLLCIRGVFHTAEKNQLIKPANNPCQWLSNKTRVKPEIDPFTLEEAELIIADIYKHEAQIWGAWYELGFFTGMRYPSEPAALQWHNIDLRKGELKITHTRDRYSLKPTTKTGVHRTILLNSRARAALQRLRAITGTQDSFVFIQPTNGEPVVQGEPQRDMLKSSLKRLKIRPRPAYNMRHTYATACLMAGSKPGWVANQLGHSLEEFFKTYARWLNSDDDARELALIEGKISESWQKVGKKSPKFRN